jgi:hypothetical protein
MENPDPVSKSSIHSRTPRLDRFGLRVSRALVEVKTVACSQQCKHPSDTNVCLTSNRRGDLDVRD